MPPTAGTVQEFAGRTEGSVLTPSKVLLAMVSDQARMTAKATLDNKHVGFVNIAQDAEITLEMSLYPYGTVPARVR